MTVEQVEVLKWLASLGTGGIIAAILFLFYRKDVRQYTHLWKTTSDQLIEIVKDNTRSNTELVQMIRALHHRLDNGESAPPRRQQLR